MVECTRDSEMCPDRVNLGEYTRDTGNNDKQTERGWRTICLLVVPEYFICEFAVENLFIRSQIGRRFLFVEWLPSEERHVEFWREKQRLF